MLKGLPWIKPVTLVLLAAGLAPSPTFCSAADDPSARAQGAGAADSGLYFKVRLSNPVRMSQLKSGEVVGGSLSRDVYSADRKVFPSGSGVRLTVDHMEKRKRIPNDHWPWVVQAFTPRHENYPVFKNATVAEDKGESSVQVSLISVSRMREVQAKAKKNKSGQQPGAENGAVEVSQSNAKKPATPTLVLEAFGIENVPSTADSKNEVDSAQPDSVRPETLPAGTHCRILLLGNVSASKSKPGDVVQARLLEPVLLNSKVVLPAGSLFEGKVVKKTSPRWLSRAGSLYLTFTELTLPEGNRFPIAASLAGAELDEKSHTRMDAEGRLHGERPGKAWMAINLGVTAGIAKEVDDGIQLVIEAIVSTATDVSTAGTARIISSCASGVYMATRHGRDIVLPRFTEMDISLDRSISLTSAAEIGASAVAAGGK
jgi:hypothetical protein